MPFERRNRVDLAVTWAFIIWTSFAMGFVGFDSVPPGNLSLFLLSGILFVYPTAFDVPYPHLRYSLFLLVAIIVAGIINFIILRIANFYSFINFILVLIIGVITSASHPTGPESAPPNDPVPHASFGNPQRIRGCRPRRPLPRLRVPL